MTYCNLVVFLDFHKLALTFYNLLSDVSHICTQIQNGVHLSKTKDYGELFINLHAYSFIHPPSHLFICKSIHSFNYSFI